MAKFSVNELKLFVVFLAASMGGVTLVQSGAFAGARAKWAGILFGLILVIDLARANAPWIQYYNYGEKYASNPIIDVLKDRPYEHRVAIMPFGMEGPLTTLQQVYHVEWLQHHFQYYNIQSLDIPQEPRMPEDKVAFRLAVMTGQLFAREDFKDFQSFAKKLRERRDPVSEYLSQKLSSDTLRLLEASAVASTATTDPADAVAGDLNRLIRTENVYRPERFSGITLSPTISNLIQRTILTPEELVTLNRGLLEAAYPQVVSPGCGS
jgi:hypothetical protein